MCTLTVIQAGFPTFSWSSEGVGREDRAELAVKKRLLALGRLSVSTELVPAD